MGCQTGFYLLVRDADNDEGLVEVKEALRNIVAHEGEMFGAKRKECGNYRELSLTAAKAAASRYLSVLENSMETPRDVANELADAVGADVVGVVGRKIILYRESVNNKRITL